MPVICPMCGAEPPRNMFNIPYFKQQISIPRNMSGEGLSSAARDMLGFNYAEAASVGDYLKQRAVTK